MEQIESKLDQGLDRIMNAIIGWVKLYLQNEQKKTDYKPEVDVDTIASAVNTSNKVYYRIFSVRFFIVFFSFVLLFEGLSECSSTSSNLHSANEEMSGW